MPGRFTRDGARKRQDRYTELRYVRELLSGRDLIMDVRTCEPLVDKTASELGNIAVMADQTPPIQPPETDQLADR